MEQRTIEVIQVLLALCNSATFNCDAAGARKISIAIAAGDALIVDLRSASEEESSDE